MWRGRWAWVGGQFACGGVWGGCRRAGKGRWLTGKENARSFAKRKRLNQKRQQVETDLALGVDKGGERWDNKGRWVEACDSLVRAGGPNFAIVKKKFGEHVRPGNFGTNERSTLFRKQNTHDSDKLGEAGNSTGATDPQRKHSGKKNRSQTLESKCPVS